MISASRTAGRVGRNRFTSRVTPSTVELSRIIRQAGHGDEPCQREQRALDAVAVVVAGPLGPVVQEDPTQASAYAVIATRHTHFSTRTGWRRRYTTNGAQGEGQEDREPDLPVRDVDDVRVGPAEQRLQQVGGGLRPGRGERAAPGPPCRPRSRTGPARAAAPRPVPPRPSPTRSGRSGAASADSSMLLRPPASEPRASSARTGARIVGARCRSASPPWVDARARRAAVPSERGRGGRVPADVLVPGRHHRGRRPPSWSRAARTAGLRPSSSRRSQRCSWSGAGTGPWSCRPPRRSLLLLIPWTGPQMDELATPILFYSLGICYSSAGGSPACGGLVGLGLLLLMFLVDFLLRRRTATHDFTDVVFVRRWRSRRTSSGGSRGSWPMQSEQLARQQELIRDQAVRDERDRIARELHDVIAHSLSAMVVQTAAAQDLVRSIAGPRGRAAAVGRRHRPQGARGDRPAAAPDPRRRRRARPAARAGSGRRARPGRRRSASSGLEVEADLALPAVPLSGGVDVSAYRVVQEPLTNALKYADGPVQLRHRVDPGPVADLLREPGRRARPVQRVRSRPAGHGRTGRPARRHARPSGSDADGRFVVDVDIPLAAARRRRDPRGDRRRPGAGAVRAAAGPRGARLRGRRARRATAARPSTWSAVPSRTWC